MKKLISTAVISILICSIVLSATSINLAQSSLTTLTPGVPATITQTLDINVVFVGFQPAWIDIPTFNSYMLTHYSTVVRSRLWYGIVETLGLEFDFNYHVSFATPAFESALFAYIPTVSYAGGLYSRQTWYNGLPLNQKYQSTYTIAGPNHYVDAAAVETWLEANALPQLGVDAQNEYTLFFINDFDTSFTHSYEYIAEPDPDTGAVFGHYGSRQMIGFGGKSGRSFFLDLASGPDRFLFSSSSATYTSYLRPIWEYNFSAYGGSRTPAQLTTQLKYVTRFVGVDMLFTPSPLYPPYIQPPVLPESIQFDVNMFENSKGETFGGMTFPPYNGAPNFKPNVMTAAYQDFEPYLTFSTSFQDRQLADYPVLKKAFLNWGAGGISIFGKRSKDYWMYPGSGIDFHIYFNDQLFRFVTNEEGSQADYSVPIFSFAVDDTDMGVQFGLGGYSDDNWVDGTQEYIYTFNSPYWASMLIAGYGFTETAIHEAGHHLALSHPHDGYDPVYSFSSLQLAWAGDHSYTVMNYHNNVLHFGVFNKDSMYRYMTIEYLNYANKILEMINENPHAGDVASMVASADALATAALADYQAMNYLNGVTKMKQAYDTIVEAALSLYIALEPYNWHSTYEARTATLYDPLVDP